MRLDDPLGASNNTGGWWDEGCGDGELEAEREAEPQRANLAAHPKKTARELRRSGTPPNPSIF